jgi:CDP-diacylglycerol---glycerol-3-phosphate 3-phosphatidyltransferase
MPSIYGLKPKFQNLLRPLADALARGGGCANQVTLVAMAPGDAFSDAAFKVAAAR